MNVDHLQWWSNLRHGGLLLDLQRLAKLLPALPPPLYDYYQDKLRRELSLFLDDPRERRSKFVAFVLEQICGFGGAYGTWHRGGSVAAAWSRPAITGEAIRPNHLWIGRHDAALPVFIDTEKRLGIGRSKRTVSNALQWLRQGDQQLAVVTNGQQWRLIFAGLDYDAFTEWELDQWLAEGRTTAEFEGFRSLLSPDRWTPPEKSEPCPLLGAINDSRKGQSDLSQILGERVRQATELLIQAHAAALNAQRDGLDAQDIYRAGVRTIMRMVVVFFAESRAGLLPRDNPIYHGSYSLQGLRLDLERTSPHRLAGSFAAFPRILALFRLIYSGCSHEALPVPSYGGELFAPGDNDSSDGMQRALHLLETACFQRQLMNDNEVRQILNLLTRTQIKIRQGRVATHVSAPVDFSSLDSEYIGILYEGLLDFELRSAPEDQPVVFLAVGNQPALPLATLEAMNDKSIKDLLEKLRDTSTGDDDEGEDGGIDDAEAGDADDHHHAVAADDVVDEDDDDGDGALGDDGVDADGDDADGSAAAVGVDVNDARYTVRARAEQWALRAVEVGKLVKKPRGKLTPEKKMHHERAVRDKARELVPPDKVILPGEWYLVRWGGTRKGSGTFYTRPQLAIPTVHRTLRPLAYDPPTGDDGQTNLDAPAELWKPKKPEEILALKVCDPACGSGSFCLAALRFLTDALFRSLHVHNRIRDHAGRAVLDLILGRDGQDLLVNEPLPCRPEDDEFEPRTRAILRRYVVERCIYGVDYDPLAVELCRLSLWIETLDRNLPLTFLNHKIKPGNSLVGAWFDQFLHYPAMAWEREGGDKNHTNGVHFRKEAWTKAIKAAKRQVKDALIDYVGRQRLLYRIDLTDVQTAHDAAERALAEIHALGIHQAGERAERYAALRADPAFQRLQEAFDLWCALWFWPPAQLDHAPLPQEFAAGELSDTARETARRVAAERRFFHWELEFPDVFNANSAGFDAVLGNPPWDISKPNSKEFFSALDPLYRGYGKQEALGKQKAYFEADDDVERRWLEYNAYFRAMSNWVKFVGFPFGDRVRWKEDEETGERTPKHDFNLGDRGRRSFETSEGRHRRWKQHREESSGYADADHAFRHQGTGDINSYKMFLEQAHALLRDGGRLGLIVPSGLYSDHGTGALRALFLEHCQWEWLFGFENREGIFDIHRSFKFNPVIVAKGGQTAAIRTAFMRRQLADWERGEEFATLYPRDRVLQFSPGSRALLEIQSQRDLEVLTKIYSNAVLLGDQGPDGWGIKYATEFHMTNDSRLFPPRPKWEEWGYRPDEYSRWIKAPWKPIAELWAELGVDPSRPTPLDAACAAKIEAGIASGEVGKTDWRVRCAQPPYDTLPIPRADIPEGIILSREADAWIREDEIPTVTFTEASGKPLKIKAGRGRDSLEVEPNGPAIALPIYEGRMVGQLDFTQKGWVSGSGRSAVWRDIPWDAKQVEPQYLMGGATYEWSLVLSYLEETKKRHGADEYERERNRLEDSAVRKRWVQRGTRRVSFMDVTSATNERTMVAAPATEFPYGNSAPVLRLPRRIGPLTSVLSSFAFDTVARARCCGLHLNWFVVEEAALPSSTSGAIALLAHLADRVALANTAFSRFWSQGESAWRELWALSPQERLRIRCQLEAIVTGAFGVVTEDYDYMLAFCDQPQAVSRSNSRTSKWPPKGFWRVDKEKHPEHRLTVLALVAFHDLQEKTAACGSDVAAGIEAFCNQNDGQGWMLPETLRLADYGLGHDDRAKEHQPVRECFGPRFYDWQLAQTAEESWRECHLHARNLLGEEGYQALLREINRGEDADETESAAAGESGGGGEVSRPSSRDRKRPRRDKGPTPSDAPNGYLFDVEDRPLFQKRGREQ